MNAALPLPGLGGHAAILRATVRPLRRLWWLLLPLAAVTALASMRSAQAAAGAFCVSAAILLQFAWWVCASAMGTQNHPHTARVVPGHLRQLRETATALFFAVAIADGLLMHAVFGHFLAFMLGAAAALLAFAITMRWPMSWFLVWIVPWVLGQGLSDTAAWQAIVAVLRDWHERQPVTQSALAMLAMAAILWRMFQDGGAAHARSWRATRQLREALSTRTGRGPRPPESRVGRWLAKPFTWGVPLWREHLLRRARPTVDSVAARAEIAALGGLHWSATMSVFAEIFLMLLIAELAVLWWLPEALAAKVLHGAIPGSSVGLMCAVFGPGLGLTSTLHRTRPEQALLVLVPGMPRGDAMNRVLARRQLSQFLLQLAGGVAALGGMVLLVPGEWPPGHPVIGLYFAAIAMPAGLLLWLDWARLRQPGGARVTALMLGLMLLVGVSAVAGAVLELRPWHVLAVTGPLTLLLAVWRWRALRRMAPFWPVGRNARE